MSQCETEGKHLGRGTSESVQISRKPGVSSTGIGCAGGNSFSVTAPAQAIKSLFQRNDSAPYRDSYRVRPIVGIELRQDRLHVSFNGFLRDG